MAHQPFCADISGIICFLLGISALYGLKEMLSGMFSDQPGIRDAARPISAAMPPRKPANKSPFDQRHLQMRLREEDLPVEGSPRRCVVVEARGTVPNNTRCNLHFVTLAFDTTDENAAPLRCTDRRHQWPDSLDYRCHSEAVPVEKSWKTSEWSRVGIAVVDTLQARKSGLRALRFVLIPVRNLDARAKPEEVIRKKALMAESSIKLTLTTPGYDEK